MAREKRVKVQIGDETRWVPKEEVPKLRQQVQGVIDYLVRKGVPREKAERLYPFTVTQERISMAQEKRVKVQIGEAEVRWVPKEEVPKLRQQIQDVIDYLVRKGFPKEEVEKVFAFTVTVAENEG